MRRTRLRLITLSSLLFLLTACSGLGGEPLIVATLPPNRAANSSAPDEQQQIAATMQLGGQVWEANCAECHGRLGEGMPNGAPLPDLTERSEEAILASVTNGLVSGTGQQMPAFGAKLPANELEAAATYARMISLARSRDMIQPVSTDEAAAEAASGAAQATPAPQATSTTLSTTDDASVIQVTRLTAQVEVVEGLAYVLQIVRFVNSSSSAYIVEGDDGARSVSVGVPTGASIQDVMGDVYRTSADGTQIFDTEAVLPGEEHIMHVAFTLPYDPAGLVLEQALAYPMNAGAVDVLVATNGIALDSDVLQAREQRTSDGVTVTRYGGELTLAADEPLRYRISGVPQAPAIVTTPSSAESGGSSGNPLAYVLLGAGGTALLIAGGLFLRERMGGRTQAVVARQAEIHALTKQIADLDLMHEAGDVKADAYQRQRSALKARLSELMK